MDNFAASKNLESSSSKSELRTKPEKKNFFMSANEKYKHQNTSHESGEKWGN